MKKIISLFLSFLVAVNIFPVTVFAEEMEEQSLEEIIRPQIEAFAKSIDQKDADGAAADAIAKHGLTGRGKDLKIGEDHPLTATLVNSEVTKESLLKHCTDMIKAMNETDATALYSLGGITYYENSMAFHHNLYTYNAKKPSVYEPSPSDFIKRKSYKHSENVNEYDESLGWMAGIVDTDIDIKAIKTGKDKIVYKIDAVIFDCFDFSTSTGSGFGDLISGIGALLFKEFTWYSTFDFEIEIPNDCEHSFGDWKNAKSPSCTEKGREERTCANCGCVDTKSVSATGHSFGEWQETKAPTYLEEGEERRYCASCDYYEARAVATLEYLPGDVNGDENVDIFDANLVRRYSAKLVELDEKQLASADANGDGFVNIFDANLIRRYAAKLVDVF